MSQMRQLAAILFTDIEGFTALMERDEGLALIVSEKFNRVLDDCVTSHGGRIQKKNGDGAFCVFTSAVEAVHAAIEIQKQMIKEPHVPLRIGIHEGDVLVLGGDLYGDGVNIASRIESFAVSGGVFISRKIYDDVRNQRDIEAVSLGKYKLKNVSDPTEIFAIKDEGIVVPLHARLEGKGLKIKKGKWWLLVVMLLLAVSLSALALFSIRNNSTRSPNSIAVLPFLDMSASKDQEYFGDGLGEELLDRLTKIPGLKVIARSSSFSFKGKNEDLQTIGAKLGVTHILEGSVRKSDNKIRITAQLSNARDGTQIWSETYDRMADDIFKIQDEIAMTVVSKLKSTLLNDLVVNSYHRNPEAYNLMLQGKYFMDRGNEQSYFKAVTLYKRALAIDPGDASIWASLSFALRGLAASEYLGREEGIIQARQAAEKAIYLDPELAEGYIARGRIRQSYDWDWSGADADYKKAYSLNPDDAIVIHRKASLARTLGRFEESIELYRQAIELDPLSANTHNSFGITLMNANLPGEALKQFRRTLQLQPEFNGCHARMSGLYLISGKIDSALQELRMETDSLWKTSYICLVHYSAGHKDSADIVLHDLINNHGEDWGYQIAENYGWRGNLDLGFYWLEQAYSNRDAGLAEMLGDPLLKNLESDPRYKVFIKKMGLTFP